MKCFTLLLIVFACSRGASAQSEQEIIDGSCECFNDAFDKREDLSVFNEAFDRCLDDIDKALAKLDKKYEAEATRDEFIRTTFDKACRSFYFALVMRYTPAAHDYVTFDTTTNAIPPSADTWFHYSGTTDAGIMLEARIRFISRDTFEFVTRLDCAECRDTCFLFYNDIANYTRGTKYHLALAKPQRVDRFYSYTGPWDEGRFEVDFHFHDNRDPTKGIYVDMSRYNIKASKTMCWQRVLEAPMKYTGTSSAADPSIWLQRKTIFENTCSCIGDAVAAESNSVFDYELNYTACIDSFVVQMERLYPYYQNKLTADRFCYESVKECVHCKAADSVRMKYIRKEFKSIATTEECALVRTGTFIMYPDTIGTKIIMEKKKQTIQYADGTYSISKIEWRDDRSFRTTQLKSTNKADIKRGKGFTKTYEILRVIDGRIVYFKTDGWDDPSVLRWEKISLK